MLLQKQITALHLLIHENERFLERSFDQRIGGHVIHAFESDFLLLPSSSSPEGWEGGSAG